METIGSYRSCRREKGEKQAESNPFCVDILDRQGSLFESPCLPLPPCWNSAKTLAWLQAWVSVSTRSRAMASNSSASASSFVTSATNAFTVCPRLRKQPANKWMRNFKFVSKDLWKDLRSCGDNVQMYQLWAQCVLQKYRQFFFTLAPEISESKT